MQPITFYFSSSLLSSSPLVSSLTTSICRSYSLTRNHPARAAFPSVHSLFPHLFSIKTHFDIFFGVVVWSVISKTSISFTVNFPASVKNSSKRVSPTYALSQWSVPIRVLLRLFVLQLSQISMQLVHTAHHAESQSIAHLFFGPSIHSKMSCELSIVFAPSSGLGHENATAHRSCRTSHCRFRWHTQARWLISAPRIDRTGNHYDDEQHNPCDNANHETNEGPFHSIRVSLLL
jgi:hypothetical protein